MWMPSCNLGKDHVDLRPSLHADMGRYRSQIQGRNNAGRPRESSGTYQQDEEIGQLGAKVFATL